MPTYLVERLSDEEYDKWLAGVARAYAEQRVRSGTWVTAGALERAHADTERLLPDGRATADHHLFSIRDDAGVHVGVLWFAVVTKNTERQGFIYDLVVFEPHRRRGHGYAAMRLLEERARLLGLTKVGLHVFGFNREALGLYLKLGYELVEATMAKSISDERA